MLMINCRASTNNTGKSGNIISPDTSDIYTLIFTSLPSWNAAWSIDWLIYWLIRDELGPDWAEYKVTSESFDNQALISSSLTLNAEVVINKKPVFRPLFRMALFIEGVLRDSSIRGRSHPGFLENCGRWKHHECLKKSVISLSALRDMPSTVVWSTILPHNDRNLLPSRCKIAPT